MAASLTVRALRRAQALAAKVQRLGRPGTGGAGGILSSTLEEVLAYADLSGGSSGFRIASTKGGAGGTPDVAYWFLFKNETVSGKLEFVPEIIKNEAQTGPDGDSGPEPSSQKEKTVT